MKITTGPKMPMTPKYLMNLFLAHMEWKIPGAVPCSKPPPNRPIVHSIHISGSPSRKREMKYGMRKAPPPFCAACTGNLRKLPSPTAEPATARIIPIFVPQVSLSFAILLFISQALPVKPGAEVQGRLIDFPEFFFFLTEKFRYRLHQA